LNPAPQWLGKLMAGQVEGHADNEVHPRSTMACSGGFAAGCCTCWVLLFLCLWLGLTFLVKLLVYRSPLSAEGYFENMDEVMATDGAAEATVHWALDVPLLGDIKLTTEGVLGKEGEPMSTHVKIPNPTPVVMKLHACNGTLTGHREFTHFWYNEEEVRPWGGEVVFKSQSHITDHEVGTQVADAIASPTGGVVTVKLQPRATILWFWDVQLDIAKIMRCHVEPRQVAHQQVAHKAASLLRRGSSSKLQRSLAARTDDTRGVIDDPKKVKVACTYVGNAN